MKELPKANYQFGQLVNVKMESKKRPLILGRVSGVEVKYGVIHYKVTDEEGLHFGFLRDNDLQPLPPPPGEEQGVDGLVEALRKYADCTRWILEDAEWRFVPDRPCLNPWISPHEVADKALAAFGKGEG